jgi:hypothetical protein
MRSCPKARTIACLLAAATSLVDHADNALAQAQPCGSKEYAHNAYTVCEVDLARHTVRLYWKRSDGTPYAYLIAGGPSLPRSIKVRGGFPPYAPHRWPRLSSDSLLILGGTALYHPAATLQVERCALSVAGSHTLPVSMVINDPHLLAIYP